MTRPNDDLILDAVAEDMARERAWLDDAYRRAMGGETDPDRAEAWREFKNLWAGVAWATAITALMAAMIWSLWS